MSLETLPLTDAQRGALRERGIVDADQLQGMLAVSSVRSALAGLLGLPVDALSTLDNALASRGQAPDALEPFERPPSGVPHPEHDQEMAATGAGEE